MLKITRHTNQVKALADHYDLRQVSSTRLVVTADGTPAFRYRPALSATRYGGVQYEVDSAELATQRNDDLLARRLSELARGVSREGIWPYLMSSEREVRKVGQLLKNRADVVTGKNAT